MKSLAELSTIVRRVNAEYVPEPHEKLLYLTSDGEFVDSPDTGWLSKLFSSREVEVWLVNLRPPRGEGVGGIIEQEEFSFPSGQSALADIRYSRARPMPGRERILVRSLAGHASPKQALEGWIVEAMHEVMGQVGAPSDRGWRRAETRVCDYVRTRIRDDLGLDLKVSLNPRGRQGRRDYDDFIWEFTLRTVEEPQPFKVGVCTDDDPQRLPVTPAEGPSLDEVGCIRDALDEVCAKLPLEDFHRAPSATQGVLKAAVADALVPLARRLVKFRISPEKNATPQLQQRVARKFEASNGMRSFSFRLHGLFERRNADKARNFQLRSQATLGVVLERWVRELTERALVGQSLDIIFGENEELFEGILSELELWVAKETGYGVLDRRLELETRCPSPRSRMQLLSSFEVTPVKGHTVELKVRASAELDDRQVWLRRGAPALEESWTEALRELIDARLHTMGEDEAIRSKAELRDELELLLGKVAKRDGYRVTALRLDLGMAIANAERVLRVSLHRSFTFGPSAEESLHLDLSAQLLLEDEWAFAASSDLRDEAWLERSLAQVIQDELGYRTRVSIRLEPEEIEDAIRFNFAQLASSRGYRVERVVVAGLALPQTARRLRDKIEVRAPMHDARDEAVWQGWVELVLEDEERWALTGEPDPRSELLGWAQTALIAACRQSEPGDIDEQPELIARVFEALLTDGLVELGYRLEGLDGQLSADNQPPASWEVELEFECKADRRNVEVGTTVRVRLASASQWRRSKVRDLDSWLRDNAKEATSMVLFRMKFADVLADVVRVHQGESTDVGSRITVELQRRADEIGYEVDQVLTFPDREARELLEGFRFEFRREYQTSWAEREVDLQVHVSGVFEEFDARGAGGVLSRGQATVKQWLENRLGDQLSSLVCLLSPNDVFFSWTPGFGDTRGKLVAELERELVERGVVEPQVQITPFAPSYVRNIKSLFVGGPYELVIDLRARAHHDVHVYDGTFSVLGLDPRGVEQLFARGRGQELKAKHVATHLAKHLGRHLSNRGDRVILEEEAEDGDFEALFSELRKHAIDFCGETFGLAIELRWLSRRSTDIEELYWEKKREPALEQREMLRNRALLRRRERARLEAGDREGLAKVRQLQKELFEGSEGALPAGQPGSALALIDDGRVEQTIEIRPPGQGYESAEEGCLLDLRARVTVSGEPGRLPVKHLRELGQHALSKLLASVEPTDFWTRFEHTGTDGTSLSGRCRAVIEDIITGFRVDLDPQAEVDLPVSLLQQLLRELEQDRDLEVAVPIDVDGGTSQRLACAQFEIVGAAPGKWRQFQAGVVDAERLKKWAARWLMSEVPKLEREQWATIVDILQAAFQRDLGDRFGLRGVLQELRLQPVNGGRELVELRKELAGIKADLRKIEGRTERVYTQKRDRLLARQSNLETAIRNVSGSR